MITSASLCRSIARCHSSSRNVDDRNPQTFVPNIFLAGPADYRPRTHRVFRSARFPSSVEVDVLPSRP